MKANKTYALPLIALIISFTISSCGIIAFKQDPNGDPKRSGSGYKSYKETKIPYGHLPPPGQCKIWIPGKPPGQQKGSSSCSEARKNCPANAWVIRRTGKNNDFLEVQKCGKIPGKIVSTETYIIDNNAQNDENKNKNGNNGKGNGKGKG